MNVSPSVYTNVGIKYDMETVSLNSNCLQTVIMHSNKSNMYFLLYEGCSNMNASGFITFFKYRLRQNGKRFYKGLYATFKVAPDLK